MAEISDRSTKTIEHLRSLVQFAYEQGFHELGYDPVQEMESRLQEELDAGLKADERIRDLEVQLYTVQRELDCFLAGQPLVHQ